MSTIGYTDLFGNDLSRRFALYVSGATGALTGYKDLLGNDFNTRFAPYVSGSKGALTGYLDLSGNDLNNRFAPYVEIVVSAFPTAQSSIPGMGGYNTIDVDGVNCVVSTQGGFPSGDTYTYLYWSNDYCATLNRATIGGVENVKFYGIVAISGQYAIAMGRLTPTGTNNFYLSSDFGKTYTVTPAENQPAGGSNITYAMLCMSGANAVWSVGGAIYYSTNYGANWATNGLNYAAVTLKMYGNTVFMCSLNIGFWYSTNGGQTFTQNTNISGVNCSVQIGTTIYVAGLGIMYILSSPSSAALNTITYPGGIGNYVITIAGCKTVDGYDFVLVSSDSGVLNYTNNGGASFASPISTGYLGHSLFANSTRIISATRTNSLFWGQNAYISNALPLTFGNCCLWLDATDTSTITLASGKVSSWIDKSTNAFVFNQGTVSQRPTYTSNSQNSLATLTFNATNLTYLLGPSNFSIGTSSYSLFVVFNITTSGNSNSIFNKAVLGSLSAGGIRMLDYTDGNLYIQYIHQSGAYLSQTSAAYTLGNYRICELIVNRTEGKDYSYQNGILLSTLTITDTTNYADTSSNMIIGAFNDTPGTGPGGFYLTGNVAEIIAYKGVDMTTNNRESTEGYLAWKWGIQTFLPSSHRYRYYRPNTFPPPLSITGCCMWLDATDTSTITLVSGKVSSWRDKSFNAFAFNQTTVGSRPTYTVVSQNSLPTITFAAGSLTHLVGPANFSIGTSSYSLFVVCNITLSNTTTCGIFNKSLYGGQFGRIMMIQDSSQLLIKYTHQNEAGLAYTSATYTVGNYRILELIVNRTANMDFAYQNGTLTTSVSITDTTNYTDTVNNMLIGAYNNGDGTGVQPGYYLSGNVAEIIAYKGADMTTTNRQKIEGYLAWKWGIQTFLPSSPLHPYRNVAPTF